MILKSIQNRIHFNFEHMHPILILLNIAKQYILIDVSEFISSIAGLWALIIWHKHNYIKVSGNAILNALLSVKSLAVNMHWIPTQPWFVFLNVLATHVSIDSLSFATAAQLTISALYIRLEQDER